MIELIPPQEATEAPPKPKKKRKSRAKAQTEKEKYALIGINCDLCGRPVRQNLLSKRGNVKMMHRRCSILQALLVQVVQHLAAMEWQDYERCRAFRGKLFSIVATNFNQKDKLKFSPDDDKEV